MYFRNKSNAYLIKYYGQWQNNNCTKLYPHNYEVYVIVVPNNLIAIQFNKNRFPPILAAWISPMIGIIVLRCFLNKQINIYYDWIGIVFDTISITIFGNSALLYRHIVERFLIHFLVLYIQC